MTAGKALGDSGFYNSFTVNYGVGGAIDESWYIVSALDYEQSLSDDLSFSAGLTVAYAMQHDGQDGLNDATANVGLSYALNDNWSIGGSLTYIAQLDDDILVTHDNSADELGYDVDLLGILSIGCDF